ncbi:MAG: acetyl/propionyl/methylcrotonyl-CoA carboxylase subunit alpha [Candidatus Methylomirabilales bacterium]
MRLLIANRGEIAVRIIRACRERGFESVAVYSEADRRAPHVLAADQAVLLGPPPPSESYLSMPAILDAARASGATMVHPGYGFLAESPAFAAACAEAGLVFVGPPADVIARMGSKTEARRAMAAAGVPVVPGEAPADQSDASLAAAVRRVGLPALIKPAAGGGGKGMRVVREAAEVAGALPGARREARSAFGDGRLYVERLLEGARHVEVQVFADSHGNLVHLFERDCSAQRRHQKVIEESPSPAVTPALRARLGAAAVAAARAAGYVNAGTVEFLLVGEGDDAAFHFLEMNTRLQVEHGVTEMVTGTDLVHAQLDVALGRPLPWRQEDLAQTGHAIECRLYAEDPEAGFLPQAGRLAVYREPQGPGIRVDGGVAEGDEVTVHYDPLLAKLIVRAASREEAIARARAALARFPVLGIRTNGPYLRRVLDSREFRSGSLDTGFLDRETPARFAAAPADVPAPALAAAAAAGGLPAGTPPGPSLEDPWDRLPAWRNA